MKIQKKYRYIIGIVAVLAVVVIAAAAGMMKGKKSQDREQPADDLVQSSEERPTPPELTSEEPGTDVNGQQMAQVTDIPQDEPDIIDWQAEAMERFMAIPWDEIEARRVLEDADWGTNIVLLGEIPEKGIALYGYNDEEINGIGVAIEMDGNVNYFDWYYMSPRAILPNLYWDEQKQQLQVALLIYTGTGASAEQLHILQLHETMTFTDVVFDMDDYSALILEQIDYTYDADTQTMTYYNRASGEQLATLDVSWLEGEPVVDIMAGEIATFRLGEELWLDFAISYRTEHAFLLYDNSPAMEAQVLMEYDESTGETVFSLGEIRVVEE